MSTVDAYGDCPWCVGALAGAATDIFVQLAFNGFKAGCIDWSEVAVSAATGAVGIGIAQKLGKVSTVFGGANRPTYRFFQKRGIARAESHPISRSSPNWYSYPHWHADFLGKSAGKIHMPLVEPIIGTGAAGYNAVKSCQDEGCKR